MTLPPLVGQAELVDLLGVTRQRIQQLVNSPDFPKPALELRMGKAWLLADVERWAARHGRHLRT